jgi:hypothetical protein
MRALRHWRDRLNHEYWPWQLIHLPVIPAALWHALRSGHGAFFTNVNPAIDLGGFFGERKHDILARLPQRAYPTTVLVQPDTPWTTVQQSPARRGTQRTPDPEARCGRTRGRGDPGGQ